MATQTSRSGPTYFRRNIWILLPLAALSLSVLYAAELAQYPTSFRRWVHVGTGVMMPGGPMPSEEGMHHIFANEKAVGGYSSGAFADGSILVYELREAPQKNGVVVEGDRRRVDVMIKDSSRYGSTGGWHFERFWGNGQTQDALQDSGAACFACHTKAGAHGFVFSQLH